MSRFSTIANRCMFAATTVLGILCLWTVTYAFFGYEGVATESRRLALEGRLLNPARRTTYPWKTITEDKVMSGTTLPPSTHVIVHLPDVFEKISVRTFFGHKGNTVRFWGYCFPLDRVSQNSVGFPGVLFLSGAEQEVRRAALLAKRQEQFSPLERQYLTEDQLNGTGLERSTVRNQTGVLFGGRTCYVMSEQPLPIGVDMDPRTLSGTVITGRGDGLNTALEREHGTDPNKVDTDNDGLADALEVFGKTDPLLRDSDGDGLIDGIEDANRNGRHDEGETDPASQDSDRDGLCDGLCVIEHRGRLNYSHPTFYTPPGIRQEIRGEDKNLNGIMDPGETNPLDEDTDGDGILDEQEYFNCVLQGKADC